MHRVGGRDSRHDLVFSKGVLEGGAGGAKGGGGDTGALRGIEEAAEGH